MAEPALKFMDGSGFSSTGEEIAAPIKTTNIKIEPGSSVPAESLSDAITSGDINSLLKQNQTNFQEQLKAFDYSPEYINLKKSFANTQNQLAGLQTNYIQNQVGIENKPIPMDEIGNELTRLQKNVAFREIPLTNQLQAISGQLGILQEERNNTLAKLQLMAEQGRYDAGLAMQFNEIRRQEQKEARNLAREYGITSQFYNEGGTIYRTSDGKAYSNPEQFFQDAGVASFDDARRTGILSDLGESLAMRMQREQMNFQREQFGWGQQMDLANLDLAQQKFDFDVQQALLEAQAAGDQITYDDMGVPIIQLNSDELTQLDKATETVKLKSLAELKRSLERYKSLVEKEGFAAVGQGRANLESALADARIKWKEAANLGALTGPDLDLINQAIPEATGWGKTLGLTFTKPHNVVNTLNQTLNRIGDDGERLYSQLTSRNQKYQFSDYVQSLGEPFGVVTPSQQLKADQLLQHGPFLPGTFNQAGNASASNQVKGTQQKAQPLAYLSAPTGKVSPINTVIQKFPNGSVGGQCGDFARKLIKSMGGTYPPLGNSLTEKINAVRKHGTSVAGARIGSVIVTKENPTYGHVATIIGKNANGYIVAESNFKQSNRISYGRTIPFNSPLIVGVINPTKA